MSHPHHHQHTNTHTKAHTKGFGGCHLKDKRGEHRSLLTHIGTVFNRWLNITTKKVIQPPPLVVHFQRLARHTSQTRSTTICLKPRLPVAQPIAMNDQIAAATHHKNTKRRDNFRRRAGPSANPHCLPTRHAVVYPSPDSSSANGTLHDFLGHWATYARPPGRPFHVISRDPQAFQSKSTCTMTGVCTVPMALELGRRGGPSCSGSAGSRARGG